MRGRAPPKRGRGVSVTLESFIALSLVAGRHKRARARRPDGTDGASFAGPPYILNSTYMVEKRSPFAAWHNADRSLSREIAAAPPRLLRGRAPVLCRLRSCGCGPRPRCRARQTRRR